MQNISLHQKNFFAHSPNAMGLLCSVYSLVSWLGNSRNVAEAWNALRQEQQ